MKYFILASAFFISASILYSARYISSGMISLIENSVGEQLPSPQTQPLLIWSIILVVLGVLSILIGFLRKD
ncbi:hypothetical protein J6TS1_02540 [Siminovitchia terrae]|uniref:Uncharacterized protein n=1 Tax=Siminovitchia terrae TaxID=1914933 RepID=A0ABQ4KQR8_SIMTE|nr:hypothetical protein J6TS1_02540 [Siminovitchia terrae]